MFIARWIIDARFGHKDETQALFKRWHEDVGEPAGMKHCRLRTGSIGAPECRFEFEADFASLADLERCWSEMMKLSAHKQFSKDLDPHVVSGSNRWEILRVLDL